MKERTLALLLFAVALIVTSCGISGQTGPGDNQGKSDLEIRNVSVAATDTSAVLHWDTTQQAVGTLSYGLNQGSLSSSRSSSLAAEHSVELQELEADTEYWFQINAATPMGQRASIQPRSFRTLVSPDLSDSTPPIISDIEVKGITASSATITWKTDDRTTGRALYGLGSTLDMIEDEPGPGSFIRSHSLVLNDLSEATTYYFRIQATNRHGSQTTSAISSFDTAEYPTLEISPDTVLVSDNGDFTFSITVRNASNVAAISFLLGYDPTMVELESVREGDFFMTNDGLLFLRESEDSFRGRVQYDASWKIIFFNGTAVGTLANGGGEVAVIHARTKGLGASSTLRLINTDENGDGKADTRLFDHNRNLMNFNVHDGWVIRQGH